MALRTEQLWTYSSGLDLKRSFIDYDVHATDGDIGKISEASMDAGRSCLVVDTGKWIFGKKRLIPAAAVRSIDHAEQKVYVSLTKDQIKDAPDAQDMTSRDDSDDDSHGTYYGSYF